MLNRRHIRLKVMQSLYSYNLSEDNDVLKAEQAMMKSFDDVIELKLSVISLFILLVKYADEYYQKGKSKYLPSKEDLNPNLRFVQNQFILSILNDIKLTGNIKKNMSFWTDNDHNIVKKLFIELYKSDLYEKYLLSKNKSTDIDKKFFIDLMNEKVLNNNLVHHILEERSIYWIDDLPFISTIIFGSVKDNKTLFNLSVFKDPSDKEFAKKLFNDTIRNNNQFDNIIIEFAKNWDLDRIAIMDKILLKMAFAEILLMSDLPVKVSINEYIEISKYYSTSKSKIFINGLLDSFVKSYNAKGKINKKGRGLIE